MKWDVETLWHEEENLSSFNLVILPGGFSYGDYLSAGRLAKFSPVIKALRSYIENKSGFTLGICNGFQILCEAGFLPGALSSNDNLKFISDYTSLSFKKSEKTINITLPIAHKEGCFFADKKDIEKINNENMIFLTYNINPNGSMLDIAGLYDRKNRIMGMMPHPERAAFKELGSTDGLEIFKFIEEECCVNR